MGIVLQEIEGVVDGDTRSSSSVPQSRIIEMC
jgi:hypothetical protein